MNRAVRPSCWILLAILATAVLGVRAQDAALTISNESPTTADRIALEVSFTVAPGWTIRPWADDARTALEDAGWTVVSIEAGAPQLVVGSDQIRHTGTVTIEPFLPGVYPLPHIMATAIDPDGAERQLITGERTIAVASLLPEGEPIPSLIPIQADPNPEPAQSTGPGAGDPGEADTPLGEYRPVPDDPENPRPLLALVGLVVSLVVASVAIGVAIRSARAGRGVAPLDPFRELRRLAGSAAPDLARVDRAVRMLADSPGAHHAENRRALEGLLADLERARYARMPAGSAAGLATRADRLARAIGATPIAPEHESSRSHPDPQAEPVSPSDEEAAA